jgi:predicted anti-sigma-YlaC factor YlaD
MLHMKCFSTRRQSTAYVDGRLREREHSRIAAHLRECDSCATYMYQVRSLRANLAQLPRPQPPASLATKLRIVASREKQLIRETQGSRLRFAWNRWRFRMDELMRPLTIPATGGLLSSVLLFSTLALTVTTTKSVVSYDVPVLYAEQMGANLVPISVKADVVLNMTLDGKGHIQDYVVHDGVDSFTGDAGRLVYNNISMPEFPSVLQIAHPITGDISITLTPLVFRR